MGTDFFYFFKFFDTRRLEPKLLAVSVICLSLNSSLIDLPIASMNWLSVLTCSAIKSLDYCFNMFQEDL